MSIVISGVPLNIDVPIVKSGLILNLDAGLSISYPGSGTTWTDISNLFGGGSNATLINGPTYDSANSGSIVFDGADDQANLASPYLVTNNFSVELWCLPSTTHEIDGESTSGTSGTSGQRYIIGAVAAGGSDSGFGISIGTNGVSVYEHAGFYMPCLLSHAATITSFTQVVIVYTNKQPSLYLNGSFVKNGLTSPRANVFLHGSRIGNGDYGFYPGKISSVKYYNRSLSAGEITQNYNALRSRYGL